MYLRRPPAVPGDLLFKSHIRQYTRMDGTVVREHDDKRVRKHVDIMLHENTHGDQVHAGAALDHGDKLLDHLREKGWKEREVHAVSRDESAPVGKKENAPEPPKIKGANQENKALVSAQGIIQKMHEAATTSDDPVPALIAMNVSRANGYLAAVDDYREKLLNHFGHKVDRDTTHTKFEKDGHSVVVSSDGDKHKVEFAAGDAGKDKSQSESVHGRQQRKTVDGGKKDAKFVMGDDNSAYTAKMNKVATKFALVEADQLTTSHTHDGHVNSAYPQEIQPRDRARIASRLQIQDIASNIKPEMLGISHKTSDGAPIVGPDGIVESGNGRAIALGLAYKTGKADEYKGWLKDYAKHVGLKPEDVDKLQNPVLVRVRQTEVNRPEFAREANQSDLMHNSPVETAFSDAERITDDMMAKYQPDDDGDVLSEENRPFVAAFLDALGKNEAAGLRDKYGDPNKKAVERIQAAVFAKVYKSEVLTGLMVESADSDVRNIINAMSVSAAGYAKIQNHSDLDVTHELLDAIDHIRTAKRSKISIDDQMAQASFDADGKMVNVDPVTEDLSRAIHGLKGSRRKLTAFFGTLTSKANQEIVDREDADQYGTSDMFGNAREKKTKGAIVKETARETADVEKSDREGAGAAQARHDRGGAEIGAAGFGESGKEAKIAARLFILRKAHVHDYDRHTASGAIVHVREHDDSRVRQYGRMLAGAKDAVELHKVRQARYGHLPHWSKLDQATRDHVVAAEQHHYEQHKRKETEADARKAALRERLKQRMAQGYNVSHAALLASGLADRTDAGTQVNLFRSLFLRKSTQIANHPGYVLRPVNTADGHIVRRWVRVGSPETGPNLHGKQGKP